MFLNVAALKVLLALKKQLYYLALVLIDDLRALLQLQFFQIAALAADGQPGDGGNPPAHGQPGTITDVTRPDGAALQFALPEGTYDIEYSPDLTNWTVIANGISGEFTDDDATRAAAPKGYYRGVSAP